MREPDQGPDVSSFILIILIIVIILINGIKWNINGLRDIEIPCVMRHAIGRNDGLNWQLRFAIQWTAATAATTAT